MENKITSEEREKTCNIHNITYKSKTLKFGTLSFDSNCPLCEAKLQEKRVSEANLLKQQEEQEKQKKLMLIQERLLVESQIPSLFINKEYNPSQYYNLLQNGFDGNCFIGGGVGAGKTAYICEYFKRNLLKAPLYLDGSALSVITPGNFKIPDILENIKERYIIAIDEVQYLYKDTFLLDLIINEAYNNDSLIIISGNTTLHDLCKKLPARIFSRFVSKLKHNLDFGSKDLRLSFIKEGGGVGI